MRRILKFQTTETKEKLDFLLRLYRLVEGEEIEYPRKVERPSLWDRIKKRRLNIHFSPCC